MNRLSQQGGGQLVTSFDQGSIRVRVPEIPTSPEPLGVAEKVNNPKRVLFEIDVPDRGTPGGSAGCLDGDGGDAASGRCGESEAREALTEVRERA